MLFGYFIVSKNIYSAANEWLILSFRGETDIVVGDVVSSGLVAQKTKANDVVFYVRKCGIVPVHPKK